MHPSGGFLFLPIGDSPNPRSIPWVTYLLIGANLAVYLVLLPGAFQGPDPNDPALAAYLQAIVRERGVGPGGIGELVQGISAYDLTLFKFGFLPAQPSLMGMLSGMFLHGGVLHLLGNMLFLWIYGDNVEARLGKGWFLLAYLGTGFAAALGDGGLRPGSMIPAVGASGAISGVLGLYFLWFPKNRVRVWVFFFPFIAQVIEFPARLVLGIYLVIDNLFPLLFTGGRSGVAYGAHLGGFFAGLAIAWLLDRVSLARPEADLRAGIVSVTDPGTLSKTFRSMIQNGKYVEAAALLFDQPRTVTRSGLAAEEKLGLAALLEREGHPRAALAAYQRVLGDHPLGRERAAAHLGAARVLMGPLGYPTAAYQHLYAALEENPDPEISAGVRELLQQLARVSASVPRKLPPS